MTSSDGVGIAHLPNQKHKIISKKGAHYTLMVCGNVITHLLGTTWH